MSLGHLLLAGFFYAVVLFCLVIITMPVHEATHVFMAVNDGFTYVGFNEGSFPFFGSDSYTARTLFAGSSFSGLSFADYRFAYEAWAYGIQFAFIGVLMFFISRQYMRIWEPYFISPPVPVNPLPVPSVPLKADVKKAEVSKVEIRKGEIKRADVEDWFV